AARGPRLPPRAGQRAHSGGDGDRAPVWDPPRGGRPHRDGLRHSRHGPPHGGGDPETRLRGGAGGDPRRRVRHRRGEPRRRPHVRVSQPAHPGGVMARPLTVDDALPAPEPSSGEASEAGGPSSARRWWRRFARNRGAVFGLAVFLAVVVMALCADLLAPYDPLIQGVGPANQPPTWAHWAGTDSFGRDMLSRIIYGARIALAVGIASGVIALGVGVARGLAAGYYGGWADVVIMRVMDGLFAFPIIILAIAMMAVLGFGEKTVILPVAVGVTAPFPRVPRADVLAVKEEPYIEAARLGGVS